MALNAKKIQSKGTGPKAPTLDEGAYPARIQSIIDLGLQPQRPYKGEEKQPAYELQLIYELSDEFMPGEDGEPDETQPRWIWENFPLFNLKSDRATSTKRYMALDPNLSYDGDWSQLGGAPVIVGLTRTKSSDGNEYNNVGSTSTMRAKEAAKLPDLVNPPRVFNLEDPDLEVFESLPDRLKDKIKNNLEFDGSPLQKLLAGEKPKAKKEEAIEDSIPFEEPYETEQKDEEDDSEW